MVMGDKNGYTADENTDIKYKGTLKEIEDDKVRQQRKLWYRSGEYKQYGG